MLTDDVQEGAARILRERLRESVAKAVPVPSRPEDIARLRDAAIDLMLDSLDAHGKVLNLTLQADSLRTEVDGALVEEKARADKAVADLEDEIAIRDDYHEWANRLAAAIAGGHDIGEHSSTNNPWRNAIDRAEWLRMEVQRLEGAVTRLSQDHEVMDEALTGAGFQGMPRFEAVNRACAEVVLLRGENERLREENAQLKDRVAHLQQTNASLFDRNVDLNHRLADALPDDRHSVIEDKPTITIPMPHVAHPGGTTQAQYMRNAAKRVETSRLWGSHVTATVTKLLNDVADAMEAKGEGQS